MSVSWELHFPSTNSLSPRTQNLVRGMGADFSERTAQVYLWLGKKRKQIFQLRQEHTTLMSQYKFVRSIYPSSRLQNLERHVFLRPLPSWGFDFVQSLLRHLPDIGQTRFGIFGTSNDLGERRRRGEDPGL